MRIDLLEDFIHVAKRQNITRSAAEIHTSQPALSARISSLEKELRCELFTRTNSGLELNESGRVFLEYAQKIVMLYKEGAEKTRKVQKHTPVRLAFESDDFLFSFLQSYTKLPYTVIELGINEPAIDALVKDSLDVALEINYGLIPELHDEARKLGITYLPLEHYNSTCFIAMMATHDLAQKEVLTRADFNNRTIVINSGAHFDRWSKIVQHMLGDDVHVFFTMNQYSSYMDIVFADFKDAIYICAMPSSYQKLCRRPDVKVFDLVDGKPLSFPSALVCRTKDYENPYGDISEFIRDLYAAINNPKQAE